MLRISADEAILAASPAPASWTSLVFHEYLRDHFTNFNDFSFLNIKRLLLGKQFRENFVTIGLGVKRMSFVP